MRVVHVLAPAAHGGLERVVSQLAALQRQAGTDAHVFAVVEPDACSGPYLARCESAGVPVTLARVGSRQLLSELREFADFCRRVQPVIVHTHGYRADVLEGTVAIWLGMRVITTLHGFTGSTWKVAVYERLQARRIRRFSAVVAVSRALSDLLIAHGVQPRRLVTIPNVWQPNVELLSRRGARCVLGLREDALVIGWVGRLTHEKGPDILLRAISLVDSPVCAAVIGVGREGKSLQRLAAKLGLARRVTWHGAMDYAERLFRAFDLFVLTSRTEGTPMVLFEAMAAHVPIVTTNVGGVPEVVGPAQALLVPPDDPRRLANAIMETLRDDASALRRVTEARQRLQEFSVSNWVQQYEQLYQAVVEGRANR